MLWMHRGRSVGAHSAPKACGNLENQTAMSRLTKDPLRNMGIVPEPENSLYENRSQPGLSDCREEAHPVWNGVCQERGQNQQGRTNHQRAPKLVNERDFLSGGRIDHREILCETHEPLSSIDSPAL